MQGSSMAVVRASKQTQLMQLRSMATIKEKVGEVIEKAGKAFTDTGKVGKKFNPDHPEGTAGKQADKQGEALKKDGAVGKEFTKEGSVGGTIQKGAEKAEGAGKKMQGEAKQAK